MTLGAISIYCFDYGDSGGHVAAADEEEQDEGKGCDAFHRGYRLFIG